MKGEKYLKEAWKINGNPIPPDPKVIFIEALSGIPHIQLWSGESLRTLYKGVLELSIEMASKEQAKMKGGKKAQLTRYISATKKQIHYLPKDRERLIRYAYEQILKSEEMGLLRGFGFGNKYGDSLPGNSEVTKLVINQPYEGELTMVKMKRSDLVTLAKALNREIDPDPPIDVKVGADELLGLVNKAIKLIDPEQDDFDAAEQKLIDSLVPDEEEEETPNTEEADEKEETEEGEVEAADTEEEFEESLETIVTATSKLADLKELVNGRDEFKKLRKKLDTFKGLNGPKELKAAMLKELGIKPEKPAAPEKKKAAAPATSGKKKTAPAAPKTKSNKYSRTDAAIEAIKNLKNSPKTSGEVIQNAIEIYSEKNGTPNVDPKHANNIPTVMLSTLMVFNVLGKKDGKYYFI